MSSNTITTHATSTPTEEEIRVGRIEFGRDGCWKLDIWYSFLFPSTRLLAELKELVEAWLANGQQEFGIPTPPAPPKTSTVFPCWSVFIDERRIVARPEWGHYGCDPNLHAPEVAEATIGILSEKTELFLDSEIFAVLARGVVALSSCGCQAGLVPVRGFRSEVLEWRVAMIAALTK